MLKGSNYKWGADPIGWVEVGSYLDWTWETWVMVRGRIGVGSFSMVGLKWG